MYHTPQRVVIKVAIALLLLCLTNAANAQTRLLKSPSEKVPDNWLTKVERTDYHETPRYDETLAFYQRIAADSPWVKIESFGTSPQGRDLPLVIISNDNTFTPDAAHAKGKLVVLVQNCIHAGESDGKDATMMLVRDIAITKTRASLLQHVVLVVMPIFNVDGHERFSKYSRMNQNGPDAMGWRVTSQNLNLNRDYTKADAPEMQGWLRAWNRWQPDFHFDNHTTDGGDWQYDLMYAYDAHATASPSNAAWLKNHWAAKVLPALRKDGHLPINYFNLVDSKDLTKGIRSGGGLTPRFSTGYVSIRNRPSVLVETHMLKPYRTRVISTYNIMLHTLKLLNDQPQALREANARADQEASALAKLGDDHLVSLTVKQSDDTMTYDFLGFDFQRSQSDISGDIRITYDNTKPKTFHIPWSNQTQPDKQVSVPRAYMIPQEWTQAIDLAKLHGLRLRQLSSPLTCEVEIYSFRDVTFAARPFEGRFRVNYEVDTKMVSRTFPVGTIVLPLDQPGARVALHLFEPWAPDSLVSWGFFSAIFEQKEYGEHYVLEALARDMMQAEPEIRTAFEKKLSSDEKFAANPWARLYFFYQQSPFWDSALNVYPIARLMKPVSMSIQPLP